MKAVRLEVRGLDLRSLLHRNGEDVLLLTRDGEERFALVPAEDRHLPPATERAAQLRRAEKAARLRLSALLGTDGERPASPTAPSVFRMDAEGLTLRSVLEATGQGAAAFLTDGRRLRFVLLRLPEREPPTAKLVDGSALTAP